jgi:molecular chaperone GrpE
MTDRQDKGTIQADIPADAVADALRSVERRAAPAATEVEMAVEAPAAADLDPAALAERARSLEAQLELSQAKGRETLEKLREEHERHLRAAADLENYRKRAQRERDEVQRFGNEKLLKDFFPVIDGLDRALAAAPAEDPLAKGIQLVRATFEQALARHGVKAFSALGEPFDPARHEALLQVPTAEHPPGTVVVEHARGFLLNERLARPAMVGVAIAPPAAGDASGRAPEGAA